LERPSILLVRLRVDVYTPCLIPKENLDDGHKSQEVSEVSWFWTQQQRHALPAVQGHRGNRHFQV